MCKLRHKTAHYVQFVQASLACLPERTTWEKGSSIHGDLPANPCRKRRKAECCPRGSSPLSHQARIVQAGNELRLFSLVALSRLLRLPFELPGRATASPSGFRPLYRAERRSLPPDGGTGRQAARRNSGLPRSRLIRRLLLPTDQQERRNARFAACPGFLQRFTCRERCGTFRLSHGGSDGGRGFRTVGLLRALPLDEPVRPAKVVVYVRLFFRSKRILLIWPSVQKEGGRH